MKKFIILLFANMSFVLASNPCATSQTTKEEKHFSDYWVKAEESLLIKQEKDPSKPTPSKKNNKKSKKNKKSKNIQNNNGTPKDNKNIKIFACANLIEEIGKFLNGNDNYYKKIMNDLSDICNEMVPNNSSYLGSNPSLKGLFELKYRVKAEQPLRIIYKKEGDNIKLIHVFQKNKDKLSKTEQQNIINKNKAENKKLFIFKIH